MFDPVTLALSTALPLAQTAIGMVGKNKAKKAHESAYNKMMEGGFGASKSAIEFKRQPINPELLNRMQTQSSRIMGTGIGAIGKGDSRGMGAVGQLQQNAYDQATDVMGMGQQAYQQAMGLNAQQEFAGQQMKKGFEAQNVAGLAQQQMEAQGNINSGLTALGQNAMAAGMYGVDWSGFGGGNSGGGFDSSINLNQTQNPTANTISPLDEALRKQMAGLIPQFNFNLPKPKI